MNRAVLLLCFNHKLLKIRDFHSAPVRGAHAAAFLAHARLSHIFQVYLILYRLLLYVCFVGIRNRVPSIAECPKGRCGRWCRMRVHCTTAIEWVSSSRIPLLFVSLASTVDRYNRLCVSFFVEFFPPNRVCFIQTAHISLLSFSVWKFLYLFSVLFFISPFKCSVSSLWFIGNKKRI